MSKRSSLIVILLLLTLKSVNSQEIRLTSQKNNDNSIDVLYTKNQLYGSYYLTLSIISSNNLVLPKEKFVIYDDKGILVRLKPINPSNPTSLSYSYTYTPGRPNPRIDSSFVYLMPFKSGISSDVVFLSEVGSTFLGLDLPHNWRSFMFTCSNKDTVCAIRKGVVVDLVDMFPTDTTQQFSYSSKRNSIVIEHLDGTFSNYSGFGQGEIFVKPGDVVFPNQSLGVLTFYDNRKSFQLMLALYYRIENLRKNSYINEISYIDPYFLTNTGVVKLQNSKHYITLIKDEIIEKELTKREIKKRETSIK
ncbi:MAG: hypothetical protein CVU13_04525 [Bacteroidetes bacterium HGW-Bacteroidetes-8]|jgi:hypothetical protein|nr:MAG: hypothetical protein CVU13_04525 [Bacteroidetes bacterium HGW-Bacteroidetes-8]